MKTYFKDDEYVISMSWEEFKKYWELIKQDLENQDLENQIDLNKKIEEK